MQGVVLNRKHFEFVAEVVNALKGISAEQRLEIALDFSRAMERSNKEFKRKLFVDACTKADRYRAQARENLPNCEPAGDGKFLQIGNTNYNLTTNTRES